MPQITVRRMPIPFLITKATDTQSGYVILISFPLYQWLHEGISVLHYTYSACLFNLEHWMIVKAQKVNDSTGDVTSSGSYGVFFLSCSGRELNFRARSRYEPHEWLPYDYSSVMHYRALAFSKDHLSATIVPKDRRAFFSIGQRVRFSPMDLAKLNVLYNCSTGYYRGGDVPSPVSGAGNDVTSEQDRLSEYVMKKGTLSAKSEN